jgi:hypothetical protein
MSRPYALNVLIALDRFGAALLFNQPDITISSLCWVAAQGASSQNQAAKLSPWQTRILIPLAWVLNKIQANHCQLARMSDIATAQARIEVLK